jgi:hypothetical protein
MKEKSINERQRKRVCAWCQNTMAEGFEPATHGICPICYAKELKEMLYLKGGKRPFPSPQAVAG